MSIYIGPGLVFIYLLFYFIYLGPAGTEAPPGRVGPEVIGCGLRLSIRVPARRAFRVAFEHLRLNLDKNTDTFFAASGIRDPRGTWPGRYYFNDIYLYSYYYSVSLGAAVPGAAAAAYVSTRLSLASSFGNQSVPSLMRVKRDCGARRT